MQEEVILDLLEIACQQRGDILTSEESNSHFPSMPTTPHLAPKRHISKRYSFYSTWITLATLFLSLGFTHGEDRTWVNTKGKEIIARAVSKDDTSVMLRLQNGKRARVEFKTLSPDDLEWLAKWESPVITVTTSMRTTYWRGQKRVEIRRFKFSHPNRTSIVVLEDQLPSLAPTLKKFFELAKKPVTDVESYEQVIHDGRPKGQRDLFIFRISKGDVRLDGHGVWGRRGMTPQEVVPYVDFIETFSVREWDREQETIKRR